jgi:hypothetical protein
MPLKRTPSDDEIKTLAEQFQKLWRPGDVIRPWLRKHNDMVLELVHDDWSWAAIADALTLAGITYRTGRPWTAEWIRRDFQRSVLPLKRLRRTSQRPDEGRPATTRAVSGGVAQYQTNDPDEPEFKPAAFVKWDETPVAEDERATGPEAPNARTANPAPAQSYEEVMTKLLGRKPPSS